MTFTDLLKQAGLTKVALARQLGLNPRTVSAWHEDPPKYATAYVELYIDHEAFRRMRQKLLESALNSP